jgi:hypothetical protein
MQAIAERRARPNAKRFDRPYRDGPVFLHHFPALRTGLLSLSPSGTSPQCTILNFLKLALMGRSPRNRIPKWSRTEGAF